MKALALMIALRFSVAAEPVLPASSPTPDPVTTSGTVNSEPTTLPPSDEPDEPVLQCALLQEFC